MSNRKLLEDLCKIHKLTVAIREGNVRGVWVWGWSYAGHHKCLGNLSLEELDSMSPDQVEDFVLECALTEMGNV